MSNIFRAAATYTNASVSALLTGFHAFADEQHRLFTLPTIFQFAKAMHYRTHLLDGQSAQRRFSMSWSDLQFVEFATLLDLMRMPESIRRWPYGRSLLQARGSQHDERLLLRGYMFDRSFFFEVRDFDDLSRIAASSALGTR